MEFEATKLPHEDAGVRTRSIFALIFGFLAFVAVLFAILGVFYRASVGRVVEPFQMFPAPRLQPHPQQDYANFHASQLQELAGTRWVDQQHKLVHVPIARAMAYIAHRGAAAFDPLEKPSPAANGVAPAKSSPPSGAHP